MRRTMPWKRLVVAMGLSVATALSMAPKAAAGEVAGGGVALPAPPSDGVEGRPQGGPRHVGSASDVAREGDEAPAGRGELGRAFGARTPETSGAANPSSPLVALADAMAFPHTPYRNWIWPLGTGTDIAYVTEESTGFRLRRYSLETGESTELLSFGYGAGGIYFDDDVFYYCTFGEARKVQLNAMDVVTGETKALFSYSSGSSYGNFFPGLGVDGKGRVYVAGSLSVSVYEPDGTLITTNDALRDVDSFVGFDDANGNFFYESSTKWRYQGYDHTMACLKVGNFDGTTISFNDKSITMFYQSGFATHHGCAEFLAGRYVADLSTFSGGALSVLDSRAIDYRDVTDTATSIGLSGGVSVTTVALPASAVVFGSKTHATRYASRVDVTGVGPRCAYIEQGDLMAVATDTTTLTCSGLHSGKAVGKVRTAYPIYKTMAVGDGLAVLERDDSGSLFVERFSTKAPTSLSLSGPTSLMVGDSADYPVAMDSTFEETLVYTSSDPTVLSIDATGRAAAFKEGSVTVGVTSESGLSSTLSVVVRGKGSSKALPDVLALSGRRQANWNDNHYSTWSRVVKSYLAETERGLMRVQVLDTDVLVEYYDRSGRVLETKTIGRDLGVIGGFFAGKDSYYLVFGAENKGESDDTTVFRVSRYDTAWNRMGSCVVRGANTYTPFYAGSLRMAEADGKLYVYTCHEMYGGSDGLHHQANVTLVVDEASMELVDSFYGVMNQSYGYVSHSFNQFVRVADGVLYRVDHGDAYPRGIAYSATPLGRNVTNPSRYGTLVGFEGQAGANYTGASVGGFEVSDTSALVAYAQDASSRSSVRNVRVLAYDLVGDGGTTSHELTAYGDGSDVSCLTPQLVRLDGRHFLLMWAEWNSSTRTYAARLALLDHRGNVVSDVVRKPLPLSDCQPVVLADGSVAWYVSSDDELKLYTVDPYAMSEAQGDDFASSMLVNLSKATVAAVPDQRYTGAPVEPRPTVKLGTTTLEEGVDYTVSYRNNTAVGTATLDVVGAGSYGGSVSTTFRIVGADIAAATIDRIRPLLYTGEALTPKPAARIGSERLVEGRDYTLSYRDNVDAGTATVTLTGKGNYAGAAQATFRIGPADFAGAVIQEVPEQAWTGTAVTPRPVVRMGTATLVEGKDYTLSYEHNVAVGTATVVASGRGNYLGAVTSTFQIVEFPSVVYRTHVQSHGWQDYVKDGAMSGTSGEAKRLEAIDMHLEGCPYAGSIEYRTHVQSYGWQDYVKDGAMSGTSGKGKRLEAVGIRLTDEVARRYDVWYRVHAQNVGWMGWAKNGMLSGTAAHAYRLEAIEIRLVAKGDAAPGASSKAYLDAAGYLSGMPDAESEVLYRTHVQREGWQNWMRDGEMAGTTGKAYRLEGIEAKLGGMLSGGIRYRTHIQSVGWEGTDDPASWPADGAMSGTSGKGLRLEAIQMELTGEAAQTHDVWYRVHAQHFGWLGWARDGESAGTAGYSYRLEGIEVRVLPKGETPPGSTDAIFWQGDKATDGAGRTAA